MMRSAHLTGLALLTFAGCGRPNPSTGTLAASVAEVAPAPRPDYARDVAPILGRHCSACHDPEAGEGGLAFINREEGPPDRPTWARVADALRSGAMPPAGKARPSASELATVAAWLDAEVFGCSAPSEPGRATMRRLNRDEYDNTIRDLLGLDLRLADAFPADDVGHGFDRIGAVLSIPPILMEKYLEAADLAIEAAARKPEAWARIINPAPDLIPPALRRPTFEARNEPVKRIGRPAPAPAESPEVAALRRARDVLRGFADRAYRRPATADELARLLALVESARKDGDSPDEAIRHALKAVLIAPAFLFHVEEEPTPGSDQAASLDDFALAARLSYFLWSSLPDAELSGLAARGELRAGLAGQVRRMLRDERARALVDGFVAQWLGTRALRDLAPDPATFPDFDEPLRRAMLGETSRYAEAIIREDRSVLEFLDSGSTFVNGRLARHYGMPGVEGDAFRRVSLAGTGRGGVLTQAAVLTVTSNPTRTSPVKRGKWVLENLLGSPPPPPPEGVEALRAEGGGGTLRERLVRHRADPACASCHARMDPLGFGLEGFDAIGARRSADGGRPIDPAGTLPGGESFEGPDGLRAVLLARRGEFLRCLAEKLLTYATGRGLGPGDRCHVLDVVRKLERGGCKFSSLAVAIAESPPFRDRSPSKEDPR